MIKVLEIIIKNPPSILFLLSFIAAILIETWIWPAAFLITGFILQLIWLLR